MGEHLQKAVQAGIVVGGTASELRGSGCQNAQEPGIEVRNRCATGGLANTVSEAADIFDG